MSLVAVLAKACHRLAMSARILDLRRRGVQLGHSCHIARGVEIVGPPAQVSLGDEVAVERDVRLTISRAAHASAARIEIGDRVLIGRGVFITAHGPLVIGDDVLIAARVYITEANHGMDRGRPMRSQEQTWQPVQIQDDVWIGAGAVITPGVVLHQGCVVGANSVVTRSVPAFEIVAGNPARKIGERPEQPVAP